MIYISTSCASPCIQETLSMKNLQKHLDKSPHKDYYEGKISELSETKKNELENL